MEMAIVTFDDFTDKGWQSVAPLDALNVEL